MLESAGEPVSAQYLLLKTLIWMSWAQFMRKSVATGNRHSKIQEFMEIYADTVCGRSATEPMHFASSV